MVVMLLSVSHAETFSLLVAANPPLTVCSKTNRTYCQRDTTPCDVGFGRSTGNLALQKRGCFALGFARMNFVSRFVC
jgi:hypothetical protein